MVGTDILHASTMTPQVLASQYIATSEAAVFTVAGSDSAKVATCVICNTTGTAATVSIGVVPNGGTIGTSHHIVSGYSVAANDTVSLTQYVSGMMMTAGDSLSAVCGTANAVVIAVTGTVSA